MKRSENHKNSGKDSIFHTIELGNWLRMNRSHNVIKFERSSDGNFYCQHVPISIIVNKVADDVDKRFCVERDSETVLSHAIQEK